MSVYARDAGGAGEGAGVAEERHHQVLIRHVVPTLPQPISSLRSAWGRTVLDAPASVPPDGDGGREEGTQERPGHPRPDGGPSGRDRCRGTDPPRRETCRACIPFGFAQGRLCTRNLAPSAGIIPRASMHALRRSRPAHAARGRRMGGHRVSPPHPGCQAMASMRIVLTLPATRLCKTSIEAKGENVREAKPRRAAAILGLDGPGAARIAKAPIVYQP